MDKSLFEKYISEMRSMQASAMPVPKAPNTKVPDIHSNDENMEGNGALRVRVTSVRGLYPVGRARVTVFTGSADNMTVVAQGITDQSGASPVFSLPAPSASLSDSPDPASRPYALYNILTTADGFRETYNYNAVVFDGITSLQTVDLIPLSENPDLNSPIILDEYEQYPL